MNEATLESLPPWLPILCLWKHVETILPNLVKIVQTSKRSAVCAKGKLVKCWICVSLFSSLSSQREASSNHKSSAGESENLFLKPGETVVLLLCGDCDQ